jgi:hypothetical protein
MSTRERCAMSYRGICDRVGLGKRSQRNGSRIAQRSRVDIRRVLHAAYKTADQKLQGVPPRAAITVFPPDMLNCLAMPVLANLVVRAEQERQSTFGLPDELFQHQRPCVRVQETSRRSGNAQGVLSEDTGRQDGVQQRWTGAGQSSVRSN